jgi:hypothetical protein
MTGPPIFTVQVILAFVTYGFLAWWYVRPRLAGLPRDQALQPLLAIHTLRYVGLVFLAPAVVKPGLPQGFAVPAAIGTALAAILALASIAALRARWRYAIPLVWLFNVEGFGDFINSFYQAGSRGAEVVNNLGAAYYIPIVIVPAAVVSHVMIFGLLLRRPRVPDAGSRS